MARRLTASLSMLAFAVCLIAGIQAGNPFGTVLERALIAMAGTLVVSTVIGTMAERMVDENVQRREQELRKEAGGASDAPSAAGASTPGGAAHKKSAA